METENCKLTTSLRDYNPKKLLSTFDQFDNLTIYTWKTTLIGLIIFIQ